jgi:hypothetical protein|tara:strand:+ start:7 stop:1041 length:1035 start_codon:yes stop_codon:yes gene_type:complete
MGGSTDGILSGLDAPKLEASRQDYNIGGRAEDVRKRVRTIRGIYDEILPEQDRRGMPGSVSNFLTGFGLNLLAQPGGSNIFQTAAKAAQTPYQQFVSARDKEKAEERALTQAIIGDAIEQESEEEQARLKGLEKYDIGAAAKINQQISNIDKEIRKAVNREKILMDKQKSDEGLSNEERSELEGLQGDFGTISSLKTQRRVTAKEKTTLEKIGDSLGSDYISNKIAELVNQINPETGQRFTTAEAEQEALKQAETLVKGRAEGGRIGYQEGALVDTPTTSRPAVQSLDFATLRARLPREISDDIVRLIADSGEALTDFAGIRTQQDVDKFNETYKVNLVLPAEE